MAGLITDLVLFAFMFYLSGKIFELEKHFFKFLKRELKMCEDLKKILREKNND